jgi:predicted ATPase
VPYRGAVPADPLLRAVRLDRSKIPDPAAFPFSLPAIRGLERLELHPEVTFLVGENGSGKSTLIEAVAAKLDLDAEGGDRDLRFEEREAGSVLHEALTLERGPRQPSMRYFLRAESFFNVARSVDESPGMLAAHGGRALHEMSHGESFLQLVNERFYPDGLFVLDEPEAALSPTGLLGLLRRMRELAIDGAQFLIATHSPILLAYPGALIYELAPEGFVPTAYAETEHYRLTRAFLQDPEAFLHRLFAGD